MKLPSIVRRLPETLLPVDADLVAPAEAEGGARQAAVLVILFPRGDDVRFLLTVRPDSLTRHAGQISLPGGAVEPGDVSLWHTAVREAQEELGLRPGRLRPLGQLEPIWVAASGYLVAPLVAWNPVPPVLRPDPREVAEVLEVSLVELLASGSLREEKWELRGQLWYVSFYHLVNRSVWGATARVLASLARRLQDWTFDPGLIPGRVRPA